jgi:hypothetical protein
MNELTKQIKRNKYQTYYGGGNGYDYCCLKYGRIICSGNKELMVEYSLKNEGIYVAILIPVTFTKTE